MGALILPTTHFTQPSTFEHVIFLSLGAVAPRDLNVARHVEISTHSGMRNVDGRVCIWGALL